MAGKIASFLGKCLYFPVAFLTSSLWSSKEGDGVYGGAKERERQYNAYVTKHGNADGIVYDQAKIDAAEAEFQAENAQ